MSHQILPGVLSSEYLQNAIKDLKILQFQIDSLRHQVANIILDKLS